MNAYDLKQSTGSRDRYTLAVRHEEQLVVVQTAFACEQDRDDAAAEARARYGDDAVTCGFVRNYRGRRTIRVYL